jgi:hypothetical protein
MVPFLLFVALFRCASVAGEKSVIVVHPFTVVAQATWPYDMKQMQTEAVAELKAKFGKEFDIVIEARRERTGRSTRSTARSLGGGLEIARNEPWWDGDRDANPPIFTSG